MVGKKSKGNTGILSNSFIPEMSTKIISKELNKLEVDSLIFIVKLWLKWPITQPRLTKEHKKLKKTRASLIQEVDSFVTALQSNKTSTSISKRKKIIDKILVDYWPNGLNILQLALIDTQCIIDKTSNFNWVSSTAKIVTGTEGLNDLNEKIGKYSQVDTLYDDFIFSLDAQSFLDTLIKNLSSLYLTHIYISRHPTLPLVLIRIQVFDVRDQILKAKRIQAISNPGSNNPVGNSINSNMENASSGSTPDISSRKPYYLAIPLSSPNIIHSEADDLVSKIIIQAVEMTLSSNLKLIKLIRNGEPPVRTLEVMHILKGVSRFGNSLGSWIPYADGVVDINPLGDSTKHLALDPTRLINNGEYEDNEEDSLGSDGETNDTSSLKKNDVELAESEDLKRRKTIAAFRFKGSASRLKSERLFDDTKIFKKRKTAGIDISNIENIDQTDSALIDASAVTNSVYSSVAPLQYGDFRIENKISPASLVEAPSVRIRLLGNDIFAGLHELSVTGKVVDPEIIPSWLTGSENYSTGLIKDNEFIQKEFNREFVID